MRPEDRETWQSVLEVSCACLVQVIGEVSAATRCRLKTAGRIRSLAALVTAVGVPPARAGVLKDSQRLLNSGRTGDQGPLQAGIAPGACPLAVLAVHSQRGLSALRIAGGSQVTG
jgi:hypothetical protein